MYHISGTLNYGDFGSNAIIVNYPMFFVGIIISHYYRDIKHDYDALGKIALFSIGMYAIGSVQTLIGLNKYPLAVRILSTGAGYYVQEKEMFLQMGIGTFGHINSAVFLCIAALFLVKRKSRRVLKVKHMMIVLTSIIMMLLMLFKASFAISLLLLIIGLVLTSMVKDKRTFFILAWIAIIFMIILPTELIGNALLQIASNFGSDSIIYEKFSDLALSLSGQNHSSQTQYRLTLYYQSLSTFISQPFFGINGPFGNTSSSVGMHSGWLDFLAFFGLFSGVPLFLVLYNNFKKNLRYYRGTYYYGFIIVIQFLFILFGLINPILFVYEIGFVVFFIIPSIPFVCNNTKKTQN